MNIVLLLVRVLVAAGCVAVVVAARTTVSWPSLLLMLGALVVLLGVLAEYNRRHQ